MKAAIAKMFARIDGVKNPKIAEAYETDVEDLLTGIRQHIINPFLRAVKWIAVALVVVNLMMLNFGESRFIDDWSALDRLRYEWKHIRRLIDWHIL